MKRVKYYVASSLDGTISRTDGSYDFLLQEGDHVADFIASFGWFDTVLMGRNTYRAAEDAGVTNPYPMLKSYLFSRELKASPDPAVTLISEDAAAAVRELKRGEGKDIWLCGGADLATSMFEAGLVDDVIVKLNPVMAGPGIPLFRGGPKVDLELEEHKVYGNGVVLLHYRVKR